ncbi:MAG TPA: SDR family NAD(P)-dependent oxidoreductase [Modestobacter sp.]|jgi:NAD(P)-dependent dehydrogenase (short-subunit alcohol dehydrogenase family)|nr:SDR family NAD(P)-dependent oxidoreductase [Modestobacter sp.]
MTLAGSVAVVTGGAGGLGEAVVREFVKAGAKVVISDLSEERGQRLAEELGDAAVYVPTDVLSDESIAGAIEAARGLGTLRYAVVAHGGFGVAERVVGRDHTPATMAGFTKTIELYLTGTYNVLRLLAAEIASAEADDDGQRGAVVTTSSIAAFEGQIGQSAYAAAKGGVAGLTLAAARDLAVLGIRVVCIAPGTFMTPAMERVGEEALAKFGASVPNPSRLGRPAEYAALARHICENDYLNGETIRIDGAQRFQPR